MISSIVSRFVILLFGTLYPAYASYKAVRTKDMKEYIKWMMYWIVFALFTCAETFTDVFIGFWFPFYYEIKIILVIWLLSPATNGSSFLYRNFVHPTLQKREQEIDEAILNAKQQGYHTILNLGRNATTVIMQTAIKSLQVSGNSFAAQALFPAISSETVPDGNVGDVNFDERRPLRSNGYPEYELRQNTDAFQYSDDDDPPYNPSNVDQKDSDELEEEPPVKKPVQTRPKRRSARSRKVKALDYEDDDD